MNPLTLEWIAKAEGDYATARREVRARKNPNYDAVCFHAQQCVEKYLKALLQEQNTSFGRTHNLIVLLDLVLKKYPQLELIRSELEFLSVFAVLVRYPGESADKEIAKMSVKHCQSVRDQVRIVLGFDK